MTRLGRTLLVRVGAIVAVALAAGAVVLGASVAGHRQDERDDRLGRAALEALFQAGETRDGRLDSDDYSANPQPAGGPATALLEPDGAINAGDRDPGRAVRREATRLARARDTAPVTVDGQRLAALSVDGSDGRLGTAIAFEPTSETSGQIRTAWLLIAAGALGLWALALAVIVLTTRRTLGPADQEAERERTFLADAAHELRTPWAIVAARAEHGLREGDAREDLDTIARTATRAGASITDMLALARLDAGQAVAEREPLRLDALAAACADEARAAPGAQGVEVTVEAGEVVVEGDEALLSHAIRNLIDNAIRHGGAGGEVSVTVEQAGQTARLTVADRGPGVAPGQAERIFDRFQRGSSSTGPGSGLGLPIARLAVQAHGGSLELVPGGSGARFVLELPARASA